MLSYLKTADFIQTASDILAYYPSSYELDFIFELIQIFPQKNYYFPKVAKKYELVFYPARNKSDFVLNRLGVFEPQARPTLDLPKSAQQKGVIFVPSVALDANLNRLGQGKGFYDRFLSKMPRSLYRVGIIPDFASTKSVLPVESWDQRLDLGLIAGCHSLTITP